LLFVGLGNPEGKYFNTYHNVGFLAAEKMALQYSAEFKKKGNQLLAKFSIQDADIFILKPLTYMNLSGQAVVALIRKEKIEVENIFVFMDDLYIDKGAIRVTHGGSGGGHNGIRSITGLIGSNQYTKIRMGIKPEKPPYSTSQYVLSKIENKEQMRKTIAKATDAALMFINQHPLDKIQQKFNTKCASTPEESGGAD